MIQRIECAVQRNGFEAYLDGKRGSKRSAAERVKSLKACLCGFEKT